MLALRPPQPKADPMLVGTCKKSQRGADGCLCSFSNLRFKKKKKRLLFWKMVLCLEDFCFCYLLIDFRMERFEILHVWIVFCSLGSEYDMAGKSLKSFICEFKFSVTEIELSLQPSFTLVLL